MPNQCCTSYKGRSAYVLGGLCHRLTTGDQGRRQLTELRRWHSGTGHTHGYASSCITHMGHPESHSRLYCTRCSLTARARDGRTEPQSCECRPHGSGYLYCRVFWCTRDLQYDGACKVSFASFDILRDPGWSPSDTSLATQAAPFPISILLLSAQPNHLLVYKQHASSAAANFLSV